MFKIVHIAEKAKACYVSENAKAWRVFCKGEVYCIPADEKACCMEW